MHWVAGSLGQRTHRASIFIISCKILCKNPFNLIFYNFTKIKIQSFKCPKSMPLFYQNNTWTIRCLVDEMIDPATHCIKLKIVGFDMMPIMWMVLKQSPGHLYDSPMEDSYFTRSSMNHQIIQYSSMERKQML